MNYVITGSLGHISKPIVQSLKAKGHTVTVVTSSAAKTGAIEALGAKAAVGSVEDVHFLTKTFSGADAAYLMIPPTWDLKVEWTAHLNAVADNYVESVKKSGLKHAVLLSSIGAHIGTGCGPVDGLSYAEKQLGQLSGLNLFIVRPSYFYYNLLNQAPMVKNMGIFGGNFGGTDEKLVLVHTDDIAEVVSGALLSLAFTGKTIRYIASDERHPKEIAAVLGAAVGKPGLPWVQFSNDDTLKGMLQGGLHPEIAKGYVELGDALRTGKAQADYWKNKPELGKKKLEDFATEFAAAYNA